MLDGQKNVLKVSGTTSYIDSFCQAHSSSSWTEISLIPIWSTHSSNTKHKIAAKDSDNCISRAPDASVNTHGCDIAGTGHCWADSHSQNTTTWLCWIRMYWRCWSPEGWFLPSLWSSVRAGWGRLVGRGGCEEEVTLDWLSTRGLDMSQPQGLDRVQP